MSKTQFREGIYQRLLIDLVGPSSEKEVLSDRPTQRYSTGILYPPESLIGPEEDNDGGLAINEDEDTASEPDSTGVSLHATLKPSSVGISFAVKRETNNSTPRVFVKIECSRYEPFSVNENGERIEGPAQRRVDERWQRIPLSTTTPVILSVGETHRDLKEFGIPGLELYTLVSARSDLLTVTLALTNRRKRGESRDYDEQQHFFQVRLAVDHPEGCILAPRPSARIQTDEDSSVAALIYRDVKEYVVGHTCSARAIFNEAGDAIGLSSEWIPKIEVPNVSDLGDAVFTNIDKDLPANPVDAKWLAEAAPQNLHRGLLALVSRYEKWIDDERQRIPAIPLTLRAQAEKNIARCQSGAERMRESITLIEREKDVRLAFQLSQHVMNLQFGWSRSGDPLVWRPFQLAFQLLALASLASRNHPDRAIMDLLWFPTGGGKTEAYLALTAFIILLRRLRATSGDDGAGVSVIMRYTLRLLTIQQFQRASAMIFACELIRKAGEGAGHKADLGNMPIGIGLWVGESATPTTLKDAVEATPGNPSRAEQLTNCPCCGGELQWVISPKESKVQCQKADSGCVLARAVPHLPIWTIDEEVYRHRPSLLIGTIDKFAQIVRKMDTRVLFGRGQKNAAPDLIIQDELHLISGPLGTIAGIYEIAIDELCRNGEARAKIIGSTATIRRASDQSRALFDRATYQFPSPGLDFSNSGFAKTDASEPGRLYVGISTAGRSATYMLQAIAASLLQSASDPSLPDDLRDYYWTLVTYFNSLRELGRALVLVQDDVPVSIRQFANRRNETPRPIDAPAELTSRVQSYEIRDMLNRLQKGASSKDAVDLLLASNMISVGMDIRRLGMMLVNAQPKTLSEYIQATSRVGRGKVPGIVVTMYNNTRARDRSHFETFETWHRCLYRDIEATSVTPFASRAQDKALHAVLVALVRHTVPGMDRDPILNDVRKVEAEKIASLIESRAASVDQNESVSVTQKLRRLLDQWSSRTDLQTYWDDYGRRISLLMSAEQYAAKADVDSDLDSEGARRALWPTPNSMREVEAGAPFILRKVLKAREDDNAQ